jgi:hypothetical protein
MSKTCCGGCSAAVATVAPSIRRSETYTRAGLLENRLFSYVRYNAELSRQGLDDLALDDVVPEEVQRLDSIQHIADLRRVGLAVARDVSPEHFASFLDLSNETPHTPSLAGAPP